MISATVFRASYLIVSFLEPFGRSPLAPHHLHQPCHRLNG